MEIINNIFLLYIEHHHWTMQETLLLIYVSKEKELHSGKNTVKHFWENISKGMKKMGYDISGQKCCIKFQAMKRTYKSIKDHNNKSGNNTKKWEYFDVNICQFLHNYA